MKTKKIDHNLEKLLYKPKQTAQEKIIRKVFNVLGEANYRLTIKDRKGFDCDMAYAKGLLESLLFKDDEVEHEDKKTA